MDVSTFVFGSGPRDRYMVGRTVRSFAKAGLKCQNLSCSDDLNPLRDVAGPLLLVEAGAWLVSTAEFRFPSPSATGRPLCALGAVHLPPHSSGPHATEFEGWQSALKMTGGDLNRLDRQGGAFPTPLVVYLDMRAAAEFISRLSAQSDIHAALNACLRNDSWRVVRCTALDVFLDRGLRAVQVITSLQQGGAERIAQNLSSQLPSLAVASPVITLGNPTRTPLRPVSKVVDLSKSWANRAAGLAELHSCCVNLGADVVHGHLIGGDCAAYLAGAGLPVVLTVHNMKPGWPIGLASLKANDAALLVGCAQAVEEDLR